MNKSIYKYIEIVGNFKPSVRYTARHYNDIVHHIPKGNRCGLLYVDGIDKDLQQLIIPNELDDFFPSLHNKVHDYARLYHAIRKMEHNLDHLAVSMKIIDLGYGERKISEVFPNIKSNFSPDIIYESANKDGYYIADVTTSFDIHQAHISKFENKYRQIITQPIIGYATIKVLSYDFLPDEYKAILNAYKLKLSEKKRWIIDESGSTVDTINEIVKQMYGKKNIELDEFTRDDLYKRNCQYFYGVDDVDDLPVISEEIDDYVSEYIQKNIKTLDDKLTYRSSHSLTHETFQAFIKKVSTLPDDYELKETSILRFPVGDRELIDLNFYSDVSYLKDQYRSLSLLSLIDHIDFSGDDSSIDIIKAMSVERDKISSFINKYDSIALSSHMSKSVDISEARDNFNTLQIYIFMYNSAVKFCNMQDDEKVSFLQKAGFRKASVDYNWSIMNDFYSDSKDIAYNYITNNEFLLLDKWLTSLNKINIHKLPIKYKIIKNDLRDNLSEKKKNLRDRKDTINIGGKKANVDLCISSNDISIVTHEHMNIGLTHSEKIERKLKKRKSSYYYAEGDEIEFNHLLEYMSQQIDSKDTLLVGTYYDNLENRSTRETVDEYIRHVTSTRMYTYLRSYSELMFSYSSFSSVRLKSGMAKVTIDHSGNTILIFFGGSIDSRSCISLSIHRYEIPERLHHMLNIGAHGRYNDFHIYISKPFSVKYDLLERWADSDTIAVGACAEDYFRVCNNIYRVNVSNFLKNIFSFRSIILLEGRSKTGRILEPLRYIIMNHISTYSNNPEFISDKYNIRPMNKLHNYIYSKVRKYVSADADRSRLAWDKTTFNLVFLRLDRTQPTRYSF
jgi:hypothetical protein